MRDPGIEPTGIVLKDLMGDGLFAVYQDLLKIITDEFALEYVWRYYKDGSAWLCKVVGKKKTVFWLSLWEGYIKTSFFFTEKTRPGISALPIAESIKEEFGKTQATGKLLPLILDIDSKDRLADFREIVRYKASLK